MLGEEVAARGADLTTRLIDRMNDTRHWQLGGRRVNYSLGDSSLVVSSEQAHEGAEASLKLTCDFSDGRRDYVSAYYSGPAIPGLCRTISFWLYGDASGCRLRLSLEDAYGRWFEKTVGSIDWTGWRQVQADVADGTHWMQVPTDKGDGKGWRPLLRRGESPLPIIQPVALRQISIVRTRRTPATGAIYLSGLRAKASILPACLITATLSTGRRPSLFELGEVVTVNIELANPGPRPAEGRLAAMVSSSLVGVRDLGRITLAPGQKVRKTLRHKTNRIGTHTVDLTLSTGSGRHHPWRARFAVTKAAEPRPADPDALFGCCFNLHGFPRGDLPLVLRLNRDAGFRWTRVGFNWRQLNPAPGVWAWDPPKRVEGPQGKAIDIAGRGLRLAHRPALDCRDAVTLAFWARGTGPDKHWQTPIHKWGGRNRRNYGAYFHLKNGNFCFSASYAKFPARGWVDFDSGFRAWDNAWHHYAATYDRFARKVALYVDGKAARAHAHDGGQLRTNEDDLVIGHNCPAALDEMLVYRRALEPGEVAALARKAEPPRDGLVAHWSFDGDGAGIRDSSPSGLHIDGGADPQGIRLARLGLEHGIKVLGILGFPPQWASTAPEDAARPWVHKPRLDAWAAYVENVTRHYKDLCQHWEIWNEPNIRVFWEPEPNARDYFDVLKAAYAAAKRGNPDCTVIMPGLAGPGHGRRGMRFLDELLGLGAARLCDAIAVHPYRQSSPEESDLVGDLRHIAQMAEKHGARRKIWFTEVCWTTHVPGGSTEFRSAVMLARAYVLALSTGLVERLIWFRLHDPGVDRFYTEHNYGLCWNDLTPKPAYFAHRTVATLLEGARFERELDVGPRAKALVFRTPTGRVAALWAPEGQSPVAISVSRAGMTALDLMGKSLAIWRGPPVSVLQAREDPRFLRNVPDDAKGLGAVLRALPATVVRGGKGRLTLRVRNPFPRVWRVRLHVHAGAPAGDPRLVIRPLTADLEVPPNAQRDAHFELRAVPETKPGWHQVIARFNIGGHSYREGIRVAVRSAPPDAGPVGHWKLDEGKGSRIADSSSHGNHGTVERPRWVKGKRGGALAFDGRHMAVIPDAPSLSLRDEVTVAFWLKVTGDTGTWQFPVTKFFQGSVRRNYGIYLARGKLNPCFSASFQRASYRHSDVATRVPLNDGRWHHVAATCSVFDRRIRLYVDGKLATDRPFDQGPMLLTAAPIRLGTATRGILDEVLVYPRALSPTEIARLAK